MSGNGCKRHFVVVPRKWGMDFFVCWHSQSWDCCVALASSGPRGLVAFGNGAGAQRGDRCFGRNGEFGVCDPVDRMELWKGHWTRLERTRIYSNLLSTKLCSIVHGWLVD